MSCAFCVTTLSNKVIENCSVSGYLADPNIVSKTGLTKETNQSTFIMKVIEHQSNVQENCLFRPQHRQSICCMSMSIKRSRKECFFAATLMSSDVCHSGASKFVRMSEIRTLDQVQ